MATSNANETKATYLRTERRWAKVEKVGAGWHFCGGWKNEIEADYHQRRDCPTKRLAMIFAQDWVSER
jgi:hypothetical protein